MKLFAIDAKIYIEERSVEKKECERERKRNNCEISY